MLAILSTACRYPDAGSPEALFANIIEGRRSFRPMPAARLDLLQYAPQLVGDADSITKIKAGLIADWQFDRARFRIPQSTFAATDLTHWLALEVAADAIARAGGADRLDRARTAVVVANTLTGEFSRAALLRLRLPFLDEVLAEALQSVAADSDLAAKLRRRFAAACRERLPAPNEDTLAGGLANTIAGRIANFFDFRGGAYTVDGACASSLVAVADAANLLATDQADAVVVGAVDLSLDPFELVGFSRNGALAAGEMRVFDARSAGFWPGEGAGFAVLMRADEARRRALPFAITLRGWGISSDGAGGLTRPSSAGQLAACRRACSASATDPADLAFVEAHGTGTPVGDPIEVAALAALRERSRRPLPIASIKANIGHAKAAAGFAGLIKTVEALRTGILPPHVGLETPHPVFAEVDHKVRPVLRAERLDEDRPRIAGVSGFGFGGINAHVLIEGHGASPAPMIALPRSPVRQDSELLLIAGSDFQEVLRQIDALQVRASSLSIAELTDCAAHCSMQASAAIEARSGSIRVAIIAADAEALAGRLSRVRQAVAAHATLLDVDGGALVGYPASSPRLAFLFTGQGLAPRTDGGAWTRRFPWIEHLFEHAASSGDAGLSPAVAQPAIVAASVAALRALREFGIEADCAAGHSLGEITALHWAGVLDEESALRLARVRGDVMARHARADGGMLFVRMPAGELELLLRKWDLTVACVNGRDESVLSGSASAIEALAGELRSRQIDVARLNVPYAFHSPAMASAAAPFLQELGAFQCAPAQRRMISSVTGQALPAGADAKELLIRQLTSPVQFLSVLEQLEGAVDLALELGPGHALSRMARHHGIEAFSVDACGDSVGHLLGALARVFVAGAAVRPQMLFADRNVRALDLQHVPQFLVSPCGRRQAREPDSAPTIPAQPHAERSVAAIWARERGSNGARELLRAIVAEQTGLPAAEIRETHRFLDDLHLSSLAVARIVGAASRALEVAVPRAPTEFANATLDELASALEEIGALAPRAPRAESIAGVRRWVRAYTMQWIGEATSPAGTSADIRWQVVGLAGAAGPDLDLRVRSAAASATGVLFSLEAGFDERLAQELLFAVKEAAARQVDHLAICHPDAPVAAFARSVALEGHFKSVRVLNRGEHRDCADWLSRELRTVVRGYRESRAEQGGASSVPQLAPVSFAGSSCRAVERGELVILIGGAKGIGAECSLRFGVKTGAKLLLVGRSAPADPEVQQTLERAANAGVACRYIRADVTDRQMLQAALRGACDELGPPAMLIYAAGINEPRRLDQLDRDTVEQTLAAKAAGLSNVLDAVPGLRRLITFGSIIGRIGLEGECHYALANELQSRLAREYGQRHPQCSSLAIEWTIWSGAGMGERLGTVERLAASGVDPLALDDALDWFERLADSDAAGSIIVTSRFGQRRDLALAPLAAPSGRFLEIPRIVFPDVELVFETTLSRGRDRYLDDHALEGVPLIPGVLALEAMAELAAALGKTRPRQISFERVAFRRALVVPRDGQLRIRIAALMREDGAVDACIRAEDDGFASPAAAATVRFGLGVPAAPWLTSRVSESFAAKPLQGPLLFGTGRFERLERIELVTSHEVAATLSPRSARNWFAAYEPPELLLGDVGALDAALQALQLSIPHKRLIPIEIDSISLDLAATAPARVRVIETSSADGVHRSDAVVEDARGRAIQTWTGAAFKVVGDIDVPAVIAAEPSLASVYLERIARAYLDDTIELALVRNGPGPRAARRQEALRRLGLPDTVDHRGDGRAQWLAGEQTGGLSLSYSESVTLAARCAGTVACDIEAVSRLRERSGAARTQDAERTQDMEAGAEDSVAEWCVRESLRKLGQPGAFDGSRQIRPTALARDVQKWTDCAGHEVLTATLRLDGEMFIVATGILPRDSRSAAPRGIEAFTIRAKETSL